VDIVELELDKRNPAEIAAVAVHSWRGEGMQVVGGSVLETAGVDIWLADQYIEQQADCDVVDADIAADVLLERDVKAAVD
jgi:hypothetical protein